MSSLNSHEAEGIIRDLLLGKKPTITQLHEMGLDVNLLEAAYELVKPELKFFPGNMFDPVPWLIVRNRMTFIGRADMRDRNGQVVWSSPKDHRAVVLIYLGRDGSWVVYTDYLEERVTLHENAREAVAAVQAILPEGGYFERNTAIMATETLVGLHRQHIAERERRLNSSKERQERIDLLLRGIL